MFCLGRRSSFSVAYIFHYVRSLFGEASVLIDSAGTTGVDSLRSITKADVLLAITVSPYVRETVETARYAKSRGARIIAITDSDLSPLANLADQTIIVRTDEGIKMFSQGDVDKRGVKMVKNGQPAQLTDFREGDRLSATIITSRPPQVMTEQQVNATLAASGGAPPAAAARAPSPSASQQAQAPQATASSGSAAPAARTLPKTASSWPLLALASIVSLLMGLALTIARRFVVGVP